MGVVVLEGLIVLALSATLGRQAIMDAIPTSLKHAIAVGIGLFITFIGLQEGHLIAAHPATLVTVGDLLHPVAILSVIGLIVTGWLLVRGVSVALIFGICATAVLGMLPIWHLPAGTGAPVEVSAGGAETARWAPLVPLPTTVFQFPTQPEHWSTFFAFDLKGAMTLALLPVAFAFFMSDFFDTMGTAISVGAKAGYLDA